MAICPVSLYVLSFISGILALFVTQDPPAPTSASVVDPAASSAQPQLAAAAPPPPAVRPALPRDAKRRRLVSGISVRPLLCDALFLTSSCLRVQALESDALALAVPHVRATFLPFFSILCLRFSFCFFLAFSWLSFAPQVHL
jgi:hypothetical protein